MTCTRAWEVRAIDEGRLGAADVAAFERHTRVCAGCRDEATSLRELRDLARRLPCPEPTELELRRLRGSILREAMVRPSRSWWGLGAAAVTCAVPLLAFLTIGHGRTSPPREPFAGAVVARSQAAWNQKREHGVERVELALGDVTVHVRKLGPAERFLVVVPDGEVEVRGTTFDVSVRGGHTTDVDVTEGVVMVRISGETTLTEGQHWPLAPVAAPVVASAEPEPTPPAEVVHSKAPAVAPPRTTLPAKSQDDSPATKTSAGDGEMEQYDRAIEAYRLGRFERAAELAGQFAMSYPSSSLVEDALFIEASSQASVGHSDVAARLAERHLVRFPTSFHARDCAILVARDRRNAGDCLGARAALSAWLAEAPRSPEVSSALGGCATP